MAGRFTQIIVATGTEVGIAIDGAKKIGVPVRPRLKHVMLLLKSL